ncbi:hypothetical protein AB0E69_25025 [Kribbella sp. NPDC026611]|uniref:hypothetical protein n=1 Tax=Kribbella sp. NPDC026611 TaxID=3154911 RepID=UPI0033C92E52
MNTIERLRELDPIAGNDPAEVVRDESRADLLAGITRAPRTASASASASREGEGLGLPVGSARRRVRHVLVPAVVAAVVAAAVAVVVVKLPGDDSHEALGPALSFTTEGNYLRVRIVDPLADTARYNKEFKKHHLNITLELDPGSPSIVGHSPAAAFGPDSDDIQQSDDPPGCVKAATYPCYPQFLIPKNYSGQAGLVIARAAKPGEEIQFNGPIDGRGEALYGVKYKTLRLGQILAILKHRGYTVAGYRLGGTTPKTVPTTYFVKDGALMKDKEVLLFVSPKP